MLAQGFVLDSDVHKIIEHTHYEVKILPNGGE